MDIVPEESVQLNMFESIQNKKWNTLEETIDKLNSKMGRHTLRHAIQGFDNKTWKLRCDNKSQNYTTKLSEVLVVNVGYK
jgi:DNA polymerase V